MKGLSLVESKPDSVAVPAKQSTNYSSPFQSHFNKPSRLYSVAFPSVSPFTKQEFKDECDINVLMARYMATGELPLINERAPQYLDVSEGFDFAFMQHQVLEAQALFNELPSVLRERFANDPARFIEYCADPANRAEMASLGLLDKAKGGTPEQPISSAPGALPASPQGAGQASPSKDNSTSN